jgi:hypothetical protein
MNSIWLLIVDDSFAMRRMVERALRLADLAIGDIFEAANGIEALAVLRDNTLERAGERVGCLRFLFAAPERMCYGALGMRRVVAIFVLLVTGCSSVAPVAFAATYRDTPACCRRDGKHHCQSGMSDMAGMPGMPADGTPGLRATAPGCPHHSPRATPAASGQARIPEFSAPQPPGASLISLPNSIGFASHPVLRNSERGPPSSRS